MKPVWVEVAQAIGNFETEVIVGLLRVEKIPTYVESQHGFQSFLGHLATPFRIYVPEEYYQVALELLEEDDEPPTLDEPSIRL